LRIGESMAQQFKLALDNSLFGFQPFQILPTTKFAFDSGRSLVQRQVLDPRSNNFSNSFRAPTAAVCRLSATFMICINRLGSNPQLANSCLPCCKVCGEASNALDHVLGGYNRCNFAGGDALSFSYGHFSNSDRELGGHRSRLG
jgi:hypothetical protein